MPVRIPDPPSNPRGLGPTLRRRSKTNIGSATLDLRTLKSGRQPSRTVDTLDVIRGQYYYFNDLREYCTGFVL